MSKKSKIIVSIVGITIVLLTLFGLTYAYYLTRISGNTNDTSINVTTANLRLVYGDDNGSIIGLNENGEQQLLKPGWSNVDTPKTFTVTNEGNTTIDTYAVVVENLSITNATTGEVEELTSTIGKENDFEFVITCTNGTEECNGYNAELPEENSILIINSIEPGEKHTYTATLTYKETGKKQSSDMNKMISGKFNITNLNDSAIVEGTVTNTSSETYYVQTNSTKRTSEIDNNGNFKIIGLEKGSHTIKLCKKSDTTCSNPVITKNLVVKGGSMATADNSTGEITIKKGFNIVNISINADSNTINIEESVYYNELYDITTINPYNKGTLANNIIDNSINNLNGTSLVVAPLTKVAEEINSSTEKILSITQDDDGASYYYRGNVTDNYVTFADMCWRIVRINGDGTIRLVLEDQDQTCSSSINGNWAIPTTTGGTIYSGNYGYTKHEAGELTMINGTTKNSGVRYIMNYLNGQTNNNVSMATVFKNFQNTLTTTEISKLSSGNWCLSDKGYSGYSTSNSGGLGTYKYNELTSDNIFNYKVQSYSHVYYDAHVRLRGNNINGYLPTLKCNGNIVDNFYDSSAMYVSTLTADEIAYAGGKVYSANQNYYLINEEFKKGSSGENKNYYMWSLSPNIYNKDGQADQIYVLDKTGQINIHEPYINGTGDISFRPVVNLKANISSTSGVGTIDNPYIVN